MGNSALGLSEGFSSIVHYLLAVKYRLMRKRVPTVIEGKPMPIETQTERTVYWVMLALNVISGPLKCYSYNVIFRDGLDAPKDKTDLDVQASFYLVIICQLISGVMLVYSVTKIRNFFRDKGAEHFVDTEGLKRHSYCFILYLAAMAVYYTVYVANQPFVTPSVIMYML
jgi:hypothetical protein